MGFRESAAYVKFRDSAAYPKIRYGVLKLAAIVVRGARTPDNGHFRIPRDSDPEILVALRRGQYEEAEATILGDEFEPDDLIIEVGSNIGYISRRACSKLKSRGVLVCVEANPDVVPYLESNLSDIRRTHDIRIIAAAIGAPEREGQLKGFRRRNDLCSGLGEVLTTDGKFTEIDVPTRSLSSIVEEYGGSDRGYSLICDAEGAEILILTKDAKALNKCRQIAIELHDSVRTGSEITPDDMIAMIENSGFVHQRSLEKTHYFRRAEAR